MDKIDLDELERLHKAATPGPWKEGRHDMFSIVEGAHAKYIYANSIPVAISIGEENGCKRVLADARYIAAACNAVPSLIARVRELERQRDFFLKALHDNGMCPNGGCFYDGSDLDEWDCTAYDNRECWITAAKEAEGNA